MTTFTPMLAMTFGDRLKLLRKARGLTSAELSRRMGVSKVTVWKWENGGTHPRADKVELLAEVLSSDVSQLAPSKPFLINRRCSSASTLGERLAALRKARLLTLANVAERVGVSHVCVWNWEHNKAYPNQQMLSLLADVLKVSTSDLAQGDGDHTAPKAVRRELRLEKAIIKARKMIADAAELPESAVTIKVTSDNVTHHVPVAI